MWKCCFGSARNLASFFRRLELSPGTCTSTAPSTAPSGGRCCGAQTYGLSILFNRNPRGSQVRQRAETQNNKQGMLIFKLELAESGSTARRIQSLQPLLQGWSAVKCTKMLKVFRHAPPKHACCLGMMRSLRASTLHEQQG